MARFFLQPGSGRDAAHKLFSSARLGLCLLPLTNRKIRNL